MDTLSTQPYRGTRDFFPEDMRKLRYIFTVWHDVAEEFGYAEYLSPLLEEWELYATKNVSGEEIVNQQLYWFEDQSGRKVAIRPEMTPSVSRMVAAKAKELPKPLRWYSIANFMRYEKPQRGRVREFFQLNADIFGAEGMHSDVEIIEMAIRIMQRFGATETMFQIQVNNRKWFDYWVSTILGFTGETKALVRIVDRLGKQTEEENRQQLNEVGLDHKQIQQVLHLSTLSIADLGAYAEQSTGAQELTDLFGLLKERDLDKYVLYNAAMVRGLDYYTGNVFEQFDLHPENRRSMFGGGRYDGLVGMFGGDPIPAVGFAPGDVTTTLFLEQWGLFPTSHTGADVLVTVFSESTRAESWKVATALREAGLRTELYADVEGGLQSQLSYANKKEIPFALVLGPDEISSQQVSVKNMLTGDQQLVELRQIVRHLMDTVRPVRTL